MLLSSSTMMKKKKYAQVVGGSRSFCRDRRFSPRICVGAIACFVAGVVVVCRYLVLGSVKPPRYKKSETTLPKETHVRTTQDHSITMQRSGGDAYQFEHSDDLTESQKHTCDDIYYELGGDAQRPSLILLNGVPLTGRVRHGEYAYYQICIASHSKHYHRIAVQVDVERGDVDVFLSSHITQPLVDRHTWNSKKIGSEHVILDTDLFDWDQKSRHLFIGVRGVRSYDESRFRVRAEVSIGNVRKRDVRLRGSHTAMVNWEEGAWPRYEP